MVFDQAPSSVELKVSPCFSMVLRGSELNLAAAPRPVWKLDREDTRGGG